MKRAALAVLFLVLSAAHAAGQTVHDHAFQVGVSEDYAAFTTCGTVPVTWIRADLPAEYDGAVRAHEAQHVAFMATFPSCKAFYRWRDASLANQIETEARAFCAGVRWDYQHGTYGSWIDALWAHAGIFARYFAPPEWNITEAMRAIVFYCTD